MAVTVPAGASVTTSAATDALTVSNAVALQGTTFLTVDKFNNATNILRSGLSIAYGGVLNLNINNSILSPLADGDSFKLFNAPAYSGAFSSIITSQALPLGLYLEHRQSDGQRNVEDRLKPAAFVTHDFRCHLQWRQFGSEWKQWNGERWIHSFDFHQRRAAARAVGRPNAVGSFDGSGVFSVTNCRPGCAPAVLPDQATVNTTTHFRQYSPARPTGFAAIVIRHQSFGKPPAVLERVRCVRRFRGSEFAARRCQGVNSLSSMKWRRGPGRGGAWYFKRPLSPALSPLVPRGAREMESIRLAKDEFGNITNILLKELRL